MLTLYKGSFKRIEIIGPWEGMLDLTAHLFNIKGSPSYRHWRDRTWKPTPRRPRSQNKKNGGKPKKNNVKYSSWC